MPLLRRQRQRTTRVQLQHGSLSLALENQ
ncbi:tetracycline resistance efflux system leader peptide [Paenibacillus sp. MER 99-2]